MIWVQRGEMGRIINPYKLLSGMFDGIAPEMITDL